MTIIEAFWFAIVFDVLRNLLFDLIALAARYTRPPPPLGPKRWPAGAPPLVSVVIPAANEERTLEHTLRSVLQSRYSLIEVIVVNDGSTDGTERVARLFARDRRLTVVTQHRGGKSSAMNLGLNLARGEYILQVDSDTMVHEDAIDHMVRVLRDPSVYCVAGRLAIHQPERSLATVIQALEFILAFGTARIASGELGILKVVSGAFGMYRTSVLRRVGLWDQPMGEDGDLTLKIRKTRGRIAYCPEAVCETRGKERWIGLTRQRYRWSRNYIKNRFRKHWDIASPVTYGWSNLWMFLDSTVYRVVFFVLISVGLAAMLITDPGALPDHIFMIVVFYTTLTLVQFPLSVLLTSHRRSEDLRLFPLIVMLHPYRIYLRLLQAAAFTAEWLFWDSYSAREYLPPNISKASVKW